MPGRPKPCGARCSSWVEIRQAPGPRPVASACSARSGPAPANCGRPLHSAGGAGGRSSRAPVHRELAVAPGTGQPQTGHMTSRSRRPGPGAGRRPPAACPRPISPGGTQQNGRPPASALPTIGVADGAHPQHRHGAVSEERTAGAHARSPGEATRRSRPRPSAPTGRRRQSAQAHAWTATTFATPFQRELTGKLTLGRRKPAPSARCPPRDASVVPTTRCPIGSAGVQRARSHADEQFIRSSVPVNVMPGGVITEVLGTGLVRRLRDRSVELPQSPAAVRAYREKGPADRRSQLLGVVDEHDIAKRGKPEHFGFEEQDRLHANPSARRRVTSSPPPR